MKYLSFSLRDVPVDYGQMVTDGYWGTFGHTETCVHCKREFLTTRQTKLCGLCRETLMKRPE